MRLLETLRWQFSDISKQLLELVHCRPPLNLVLFLQLIAHHRSAIELEELVVHHQSKVGQNLEQLIINEEIAYRYTLRTVGRLPSANVKMGTRICSIFVENRDRICRNKCLIVCYYNSYLGQFELGLSIETIIRRFHHYENRVDLVKTVPKLSFKPIAKPFRVLLIECQALRIAESRCVNHVQSPREPRVCEDIR